MSEKNLYIACLVMRDPSNQGNIVGLARPSIAGSEEEALNETLAALRESAPEVNGMEEVIRMVKPIPHSFLEQAATEVLGWSKPDNI